jgi:RNA polymerase sigma-70 factor (ECF subfamily)
VRLLDHPVIQLGLAIVLRAMNAGAPCSEIGLPAVFLAALRIVSPDTRSRIHLMSRERPDPADPAYWSRLIEAIAARRDEVAFADLFEHFAPRVKTFMRRSGLDEGSADELAQETLLSVWRKADLFDGSSAGAAAWIFTIARNLRIDALRRNRRGGSREPSGIEAEFQIDDSPQPDSLVARAQADQQVRSALSALSDDQMRVVELSFYEEKAHAEIAEILEIPVGTVKSRLRLAMARLRNLLGDPS